PGDDFSNEFYFGPKATMIGFAHQIAGHEDAARLQWQAALKSLERQKAKDPWLESEWLFVALQMLPSLLLGDAEHSKEASQMLSLYLQLGGPEQMPVPAEWE